MEQWDVGSAFDGATFQIEGGEALTLQDSYVLHEYDVKKSKFVGVDIENTIYSCQKRLVIGVLNMCDVIVKHGQHASFICLRDGLDQILVVM